MTAVNDYVEIYNETGKYILGIGHIEGTNDIHISLNCIVFDLASKFDLNQHKGTSTNHTLKSTRFINGYYSLSKDASLPLRNRYINLLKEQYKNFVLVSRELHPFVKDFKCIVG